jgi:nitrite reductase (NADH) large subunit
MSTREIELPVVPAPEGGGIGGLWRLAQGVSVVAAVSVVLLLLVQPELGLYLTWSVLIPAVPALLLIAPRVWRNLCPISVVHQLPRVLGRGGRLRLGERSQRWAPGIAVAGLFLIVPLRHVLFNESGFALALFVLAVLVVALVGGLAFAGKSGWCSTFCPVGPVEKLYGQDPIVHPAHAHCATCIGCTDACYDRDGPQAVRRLLGADGSSADENGPGGGVRRAGLLRTPTGVFTAAFPGFVLGYFTITPPIEIGPLYLHMALFVLASVALFAVGDRLLGARVTPTARAAAAAAAGLYYWFTVPAVIVAAEAMWSFGPAPNWLPLVGQALLLGLVGFWWLGKPAIGARSHGAARQR